MMKSRTSWLPKLRPEQKPEVGVDPRSGKRMLIPTPLLVAEEMRRIRRGRVRTPQEIRERLALRFRAGLTCPMTTGIFINIVAAAAEEQRAAGRRPLAPWWRVVVPDGRLNPKLPPGTERQAELLRAEGHRVELTPRGLRLVS